MSVLAALALAGALALLLPAGPRLAPLGRPRSAARGPALMSTGATAAVCWALAGSPRLLVLTLLCAGAVGGGVRLWLARRRDRAALATRSRVVELCDAVQAELAAGQTPDAALRRAAAEWPVLDPVARTAGSGGDVPTALRGLAAQPGAGALRVVAAAWQVAHRTGHGLADVLGRVADDLRAAERTRRVVAGELASARATARLLAALPVVALAMGSGAGADPWRFLLGHPVGVPCLAAGLACGYAGLAWIEALARDVERDHG